MAVLTQAQIEPVTCGLKGCGVTFGMLEMSNPTNRNVVRCHPWKGRRVVRCLCRHGRMMTAFDCASEVWRDQAESASSEYATELEQYRRDNPPPHLSDYMKSEF